MENEEIPEVIPADAEYEPITADPCGPVQEVIVMPVAVPAETVADPLTNAPTDSASPPTPPTFLSSMQETARAMEEADAAGRLAEESVAHAGGTHADVPEGLE